MIISKLKFFERVWENIPLDPPYKGGSRGMFSQFLHSSSSLLFLYFEVRS